jgi:hypothetical protein
MLARESVLLLVQCYDVLWPLLYFGARGLASSHEGLGRALGRHLHTGFIKVNIQCDRYRMTTRCN